MGWRARGTLSSLRRSPCCSSRGGHGLYPLTEQRIESTADTAATPPKTRAAARPLVYPPTATPPTSTPAAYSPGSGRPSFRRSTRQPSSTASPPIVCVIEGATSTATNGGTLTGEAGLLLGGESALPFPLATATLYSPSVRSKFVGDTPLSASLSTSP